MAYEIRSGVIGTLVAGADLTASQYRYCVLDGSGNVVTAGAGVAALGVLQNKPAATESVELFSVGGGYVTKVEAGALIAIGNKLTPDASGRAVVAGVGDYINGTALEAASAAGEFVAAANGNEGKA